VEDYIHRIGRTGRAGATGDAYTLFTMGDAKYARELAQVMSEAGQEVRAQGQARLHALSQLMAVLAGAHVLAGRWQEAGSAARRRARGAGAVLLAPRQAAGRTPAATIACRACCRGALQGRAAERARPHAGPCAARRSCTLLAAAHNAQQSSTPARMHAHTLGPLQALAWRGAAAAGGTRPRLKARGGAGAG
jgi:superfamily II DNA/RNA helicase